ncbi:MAG: DnaJ domain-containing protein [Bacillota bacterium]|jgi:molecular chaperone DnaJ
MKNYYEILGVRENATKEEIRDAYRELVKKYHPDKYRDNPLSDLAEEKMKEINEAYNYLMNHVQNPHNGSQSYQSHQGYQNRSESNEGFQRVRAFIQAGNLDAAYALLQNLDRNHSDWYFLNGLIALNRGWYQQAADNIQTAMRMNPGNPEYAAAWNSINMSQRHYQAASRQRGYNQGGLCDLCTCLFCSDCCCECCGGDLIECC